MEKRLGEIVSVYSGIYSQFEQFGNATYLQANYFNKSGLLDENIRPNLVLNKQTEKHILSDGDILFAAKGHKNFAVSIKAKMGLCIASSTFLVLKIKDEFQKMILPEYLVWFLNHPNNISYLKAQATGTGLPLISKRVLEDLKITLPVLSIQEITVIVDDLRRREKQLKTKIEILKEKRIQQLLFNLTETNTINGK